MHIFYMISLRQAETEIKVKFSAFQIRRLHVNGVCARTPFIMNFIMCLKTTFFQRYYLLLVL